MFTECWFTSNNVSDIEAWSNNAWNYEAEWSSLLLNTYAITLNNVHSSNQRPTGSIYEQPTRVSAIYSNRTDYIVDYGSNAEFTLNSIRASWYNNYPALNANAELVDVNCLAVFTACNDTDICSIQLPWCYNYQHPPTTTTTAIPTTPLTTITATATMNSISNTTTTVTAAITTSSTAAAITTEVGSRTTTTMNECMLITGRTRLMQIFER